MPSKFALSDIMKRLTIFLLATVLATGVGLAEDLHKFTSADGAKSFLGTLMDVNGKSQTVKVRHQQGKIMSFKMSLLSTADQDYIKERAPILAAGQGLQVDTDMNRKSGTKKAAGTWLCEKNHYSFDVSIENTRPEAIDSVECDYSIFIERERRDVENQTEVITGTHTISSFLGQSDEFFTTSEATLENWSDNPPIPSGGGGG